MFCQIMVFGHFGLANTSFQLFFIFYGLSAYFKFMLPLFLILYFDTKSSQIFLWTIFLSNHFFYDKHYDTRTPLSQNYIPLNYHLQILFYLAYCLQIHHGKHMYLTVSLITFHWSSFLPKFWNVSPKTLRSVWVLVLLGICIFIMFIHALINWLIE